MRNSPFLIILISLMVLLDFYVFQALKVITYSASPKARSVIYIIYWSLSILAQLLLLFLPMLELDTISKGLRSVVFAVLIALFFAKFTAAVFMLVDDVRRLVQWTTGKVMQRSNEPEPMEVSEVISRSAFLSWLGVAAGSSIFGSLLFGFSNKYNYRVKKVPLSFTNLPAAFKGLKIVQISDIHSGSLNDKLAVQKGVETILQHKPDLILFTGDLVNNRSDEMDWHIDLFSQLKAPLGVYSVLGNHDYGDYEPWPSTDHKEKNLARLKQIHADMGWRLLLNEHVMLEREQERIALLGVENWSAKARFPKYGKLQHAHAGTEDVPFKILMSHDPSHWDAEVRQQYQDIDLMLAGHTHGMQFGVELPWFKWSPVQYVYKQWAGLYEEGAQKLYVNRGFGFLGYPGRVGILPEITLFELS